MFGVHTQVATFILKKDPIRQHRIGIHLSDLQEVLTCCYGAGERVGGSFRNTYTRIYLNTVDAVHTGMIDVSGSWG